MLLAGSKTIVLSGMCYILIVLTDGADLKMLSCYPVIPSWPLHHSSRPLLLDDVGQAKICMFLSVLVAC